MHPVTFALFFFHQPWRDFSVALPLCEPKRLCLDIDFTVVVFLFFYVFCLKVCVFPLDLYEMTRRPPPRNVTLFEEVLADTCVLHYFVLLWVTAFLFSHLHEAFLLLSSHCLLHPMHNTRRVTRRTAQVRFHSKIN